MLKHLMCRADMLRKKVKEWRDIFGNDTMKIIEVSV